LKIACPSCEAKYSIGDEKVQNRLAKIRCRKCGADIVIDGRVEPPSITLAGAESTAGAVASAGAASQPEFTVDFAENDQRTLNLSDIVDAYNAGQVTAETFVWSEGMSDWTPLGQVPEIVDALNVAATQQAQPAPLSAQSLSAQRQTTTTTSARTTTKGGAGRDLFDRVANAGSEEDVAATQGGGYDAAPAQITTGARNESSVLFSLSALTASTKSKPTSVPAASASVTSALDDSGLIDLKALASQASAAEAASAASPMGSPLGSPLGGAPPLGLAPLGGLGGPLGGPLGGSPFGGGSPLSAADLAMPPQKSKTGLFIGGGIALAAIIVAAAIALRPEPPPPPAPDPLPLPKPTQTAEPTPQPSVVTATPPPTGTEDSTTKKAPPKNPIGGGGRTRPPPKGGGSTGSGNSTGNANPPPPKPAGGSGCPPGDLICEMKKAAGKK